MSQPEPSARLLGEPHAAMQQSTPPSPTQEVAGSRPKEGYEYAEKPARDEHNRPNALSRGKGWTLEACSFLVAVASLAGLVATLVVHQTKPLPEWPQLVTINSIISLFALVMRACIGVVLAEGISQCKWNWFRKSRKLDHMERLELASRSSWGSISLLWHFPKQPYFLAAFGAIITIMASLLGFFTQQLVQFRDCFEMDPLGGVSLSRTNNYTQSGAFIQNMVPTDYPPMVAAINVGIIQPVQDMTNQLSRGCSTGNCTFPSTDGASFESIGISHHCEDISSHIRVVNESVPGNSSMAATLPFLGLDYGINQTIEFSKGPDGIPLRTWVAPIGDSLSTVYLLFRPNMTSTDFVAINCSVYPTIDTYASSINESVLHEHIISSTPMRTLISQFPNVEPPIYEHNLTQETAWWAYKTTTKTVLRNGTRESCAGSADPAPDLVRFMKPDDSPVFINSTGQENERTGWRWWYFPHDCIWSIHLFSAQGIYKTFAEIFDDKELRMGRRGGYDGPVHLRKLSNEGNLTLASVDGVMAALASSMTAVIRSSGREPALENLRGEVWFNTTCVYVRWSWISFPAALVGLTALFFVAIVVENWGVQSDRLWKSSFLAALFCDVDVQDKPVGKDEMATIAKSTSVSVQEHSTELKLVSR